MTIEEQRLSELLHRLTPEPPRTVTVESVAIRLANKNAPARGAGRGAAPMSRGEPNGGSRFSGRGRLTPLLAAAAVVVIAGASAGVAVALSSNTTKTPSALSGVSSSATSQAATVSPSPAQPGSSQPSPEPVASGQPVTNGTWDSSVVASVTLTDGTLVSSGDSLYAFTPSNLLEIDPSTGQTTHEAPSDGFPGQAPVIAGNKVWEVTTYGGGIGLSGYSVQTLAADGTITVPASGALSGNPEGVLAAGPDGNLYMAAGTAVVEVNPSSGSVVRRFPVPGGTVNSVAVSPDGGQIYAGIGSGLFRIVELDASSGATLASASVGGSQSGGDLVASPGGVWFTTSGGTAERIWFAPSGSLSSARLVEGPAVGGDEAVPTYADGAVWVGGTKKLECLDPDTGQVRASSLVPSDDQVPEGIGDVATAGGHVFALYENNRTEFGGVAVLSPPAACTSSASSSSGGAGS